MLAQSGFAGGGSISGQYRQPCIPQGGVQEFRCPELHCRVQEQGCRHQGGIPALRELPSLTFIPGIPGIPGRKSVIFDYFIIRMTFHGWNNLIVPYGQGRAVAAIAPVIVSASRVTDIPSCYADWFMNRLRAGYVRWTNPFNPKQVSLVSFRHTRALVFWSKNPAPMLPHLRELDATGIGYYFQFTLNDYEPDGLEPGLPPLAERVDTFRRFADTIGPERVVWRFDPLILTGTLTVDLLLDRIALLAGLLRGYTETLVFSFVDIDRYRKVHRRLSRYPSGAREFQSEEMARFASGLVGMNHAWRFSLATCAEEQQLEGIAHNRCIDGALLARLFGGDRELAAFLGLNGGLFGTEPHWERLRHQGQREACGCIVSKDIGAYSTCAHRCAYCYANGRDETVMQNCLSHDPAADRLAP